MNPEEYRRLADLEATHWWYRALHAAVFDLIARHRDLLPSYPQILDAGCGTGHVARRLAALGDVIGVDFSEHAAAYWKSPPRPPNNGGSLTPPIIGGSGGPNPAFLRASVGSLPFRDSTFDLVVSLDVLYHRAVRDDTAAAREIARVLRPGGLLLLNLPAYDALQSRHDRAIHTARRYTRGRVRDLMLGAGVTPLRLGHWNTFLFPLAAAARLWGRLRPSEAHGSDVRPAPAWQDRLFSEALRLELALRGHIEMPFGLSVIALGRKDAPVGGRREEELSCMRS